MLPSFAREHEVFLHGTKYAGTQTVNALIKSGYFHDVEGRKVRLTPKAYEIPEEKLPEIEPEASRE